MFLVLRIPSGLNSLIYTVAILCLYESSVTIGIATLSSQGSEGGAISIF